MKQTLQIAAAPSASGIIFAAAARALLVLSASLAVMAGLKAEDFTGTLYWDPSVSGSTTLGGSGTWSDTNVWWNASGPASLTWVSGTTGTVKDYGDLRFGGLGQSGTYKLTLDLDTIQKPLATSPAATSSNLTILGFRFSGDYEMTSAAANGTVIEALGSYSSVRLFVDSGKHLHINGSDNPITIQANANVSGGNNPANNGARHTILLAGGGHFTLSGSVTVNHGSSLNGRISIGEVTDSAMTTLDLDGPGVLLQGARLWLDNAIVNVDGSVIALSGNATSQTLRSVLHIGSLIADASTAPSVLNINSGTVSALGNPSASALASGVWYLDSGTAGSGGTINLNGGELITTNIQVNSAATASQTAEFIFNGGTLSVAASAATNHLNTFINGFQNSETNRVAIAEGGAYINTEAIPGKRADILSVISGSGNLVKLGANSTLGLNAVNTYTGTTIVISGSMRLGVADAIAASRAVEVRAGATIYPGGVPQILRQLSGDGAINRGNATVTLRNDLADTSFAGTLTYSTSGTYVKDGAKTLALAGDNSAYAARFLVSEGALLLASGANLGGLVTVENGAILGGLGTATGTVALNSGGILQPGTAAAGVLTVDTLQLNAGSILGFNIDAGNASSSLNVTNPVTFLSGSAADIVLNLNALISGTYDLGNITSLDNAVVKYDGLSIGGRQSADLDIIGGTNLQLTLDAGSSLKVIWTGQNDGVWNLSGTNWKKESDSSAVPFVFGDTVVFDDSLTTDRRDITLATDITVSDMIVSGTGNYSFTSRAITTDAASVNGSSLTGATGKLVMNGTGTLTLAPTGTNDFKGGIELQNGTLVAATSGALGAAGLTGSGTLAKTGTDVLDIATDKLAGTIALNIDEGILRLSKSTSGAYTFANQLTGDGMLAVKLTGIADTLSLGAGSTGGFSGTLAIESASFTLDASSAAQLSTASLSVGAGSHINKASGDMSIAGLSLDGGTIQFAVNGISPDGILTVGTLNTGSAGAETVVMMDLGSGGSSTQLNPAVPPATNILDHDNGSATGEKVIAVTGSITGAGTLKLTGTDGNPVAGSITSVIEQYVPGSGTLKENVADATYSAALVTGSDGVYLGSALTSISVYDGKQLILDNSAPGVDNAFTIGISGSGGLRVRASGTIVLSGSNTYTGITMLASGVTRAARADIFKDSAGVSISAGATFETGGADQTLRHLHGAGTLDLGGATLTLTAEEHYISEFSGALTGAGHIIKTGSGALTLSGVSTRGTGTTGISEGRLIIKNNLSALGSGVVSFSSSSAVLEFNTITSGTYNSAITGGGIVAVRDSNFAFGNSGNRLSEFILINSTVLPTSSVHALGSTTSHVYIDPTSALYVSYGHSTTTNALRVGSVTVAAGGKLLYGLNGAVNKFDLTGGVLTLEDGAVIGFAGRVADGIYDLVEDGFGTIDRQGALVLDKGPNKMVQWRATDNGDIELITLSFDPTVQVSMTFDAMTAAMSAVYNRMSESFLLPVIEANRSSKINGLWMRGFASSAEYDETADQYGHTEDTYGVVVGFDALSKNRKYLMGVYGGFAGSTLETDANAKGEADQQFAGLYGAAKWGRFYIGIDGMAGWSKSDNTRHQADGGVSEGTSNANYYGGSVEAGLVFHPTQTFTLKPAVGLHYLNAEFGAYKERGDSAIAYPDVDQDLLQSLVSVQASWKFTTPWGWPSMADLTYAWRQGISEKSDDVVVRFVSDTTQAPYAIRAGDYARGGHSIGGGIRSIVNDSLSLGLAYDFEIASHRSRHTVNGTVRWSW
ncbi:autotransporter domain-containing protein [Termitidicoccus mucosus]|uniref:autotransporter domain-containing protein n=1 Tax=Termitidicoccus mucosus TaxID=1184151 RepID=UPI0031833449